MNRRKFHDSPGDEKGNDSDDGAGRAEEEDDEDEVICQPCGLPLSPTDKRYKDCNQHYECGLAVKARARLCLDPDVRFPYNPNGANTILSLLIFFVFAFK